MTEAMEFRLQSCVALSHNIKKTTLKSFKSKERKEKGKKFPKSPIHTLLRILFMHFLQSNTWLIRKKKNLKSIKKV